jgi:hypothetical protein
VERRVSECSCRCASFTVTFLEIKKHIIHCIRKNQRISLDDVSFEVSINNGSKKCRNAVRTIEKRLFFYVVSKFVGGLMNLLITQRKDRKIRHVKKLCDYFVKSCNQIHHFLT